ncbi:MAG: alkaline phosphatase [Actinobacteria bacterium]|nr:alkaline phosphatase [Actinomycetota bacterium]
MLSKRIFIFVLLACPLLLFSQAGLDAIVHDAGQIDDGHRLVGSRNQMAANLLQADRGSDILKEKETLKPEKFGPNHQYKRYIREVVFWTEIGYYDHALQFLDDFSKQYPNDPEGFYGYSLVYAAKKNPQESFKYMLKAIDAGLPLSRFMAGPEKLFSSLWSSVQFQQFVAKHSSLLVHGPMVGDVTGHSAKFWLRTWGRQPVQIIAREKGGTDFLFRSAKKFARKEKEFTAILELKRLKPQTTYEYKLIVNYEQQHEIFTFTTFPQQGQQSKFLLGFGDGAGYTPQHEYMWNTILAQHPQFFLLLGDNVYIDHPERPATQQFCYYRIQSRPEYRRFTGNTPVYAIWDDHDFTFNDGVGSPFVNKPAWKMNVWRLFKNQWNNPFYGGGEEHPGCWFDFPYGDVEFIMLDCRYYREQPKGNPAASMLGKFQKQWLFSKLKNSKATFKVIASSVPWAKGTKPGSLDTWDGHPREREEIFKFIENNKIEGVILLSADRHRSDAWKIERPEGYDFYEFESSKLTNIHTHKIMPGAIFGYNKKCSFGQLYFDTTKDNPQVTYRIFSIDNEEIFRMTVFKSDLSFIKK